MPAAREQGRSPPELWQPGARAAQSKAGHMLHDERGRSNHGGASWPLPSWLARLRVATGGVRPATLLRAAVVALLLMGALLRWALPPRRKLSSGVTLEEYDPWPSMLRFLWDELPFGGIAVRAHGFGSIEGMRRSDAGTVLIAHPKWHGILAATQNIDDPLLEMPGVMSDVHKGELVAALVAMRNLTNVVIQGVPPGTLQLAAALHAAKPSLRVFFAFHGAPSNLFHIPAESDLVEELLAAAERGDVYKLGWVKAGFAPLLGGMAPRARVGTVWNFPAAPLLVPDTLYSQRDGRRHIGVLGSGLLMKNILSQVLAACMLPGVVVHVLEAPGAAYLRRCASPVVAHGFLSHAAFTRVLARMDVSMYVSISECMPMVVLESLALGVPALTSSTSLVYAVDPLLEAALVVPNFDTPSALQTVLLGALARRDELGARGRALLDWFHAKASVEWDAFLERDGAGIERVHNSGVGASSSGGKLRASPTQRADDVIDVMDRLLAADDEGRVIVGRVSSSPLCVPSPVAVSDWRGAAGVATRGLPYVPFVHTSGDVSGPSTRGVATHHAAGAARQLSLAATMRASASSEASSGAPSSRNAAPPLHVALFAYELAPVAAGGAGVVIAALALELLARGHTVTVLAYMPCGDAARWEQLARRQLEDERLAASSAQGSTQPRKPANATGGSASDLHTAAAAFPVPLRLLCVPDILSTDARAAADMAAFKPTGNLWLSRAREFAIVTRIAYEASPFDVLEVFDYAGIGFELLRDRQKQTALARAQAAAAAADGGTAVQPGDYMLALPRAQDGCDGRPAAASRDAASALPYLPLHVPIAVRAHGTLQMIDQVEGARSAALDASAAAAAAGSEARHNYDPPTAGFEPSDPQLTLMYRMEQYGLAAADAVLAQSPSMVAAFTRSYALRPSERVVLAPPPMVRILAPLSQARTAIGTARQAGIGANDGGLPTAPRLPLVLVYGKMQLIKGTHTVIDALALLASGHEPADEEPQATPQGGGNGGTSRPPRPQPQSPTQSPLRRRLGQAMHRMVHSSTPRFSVMFVGLDTPFPRHGGRKLSECIRAELEPLVDFEDLDGDGVGRGPLAGVEVLPPVPRDDVPAFLARLTTQRRLAGAVLASEFETYSMAIHELAFLGIPIVASDIPAYDAVGSSHAPFRFRSGNATALAAALHGLLEAEEAARAAAPSGAFLLPPLQYDDPVAPYVQLAAAAAARREQQLEAAAAAGPLGRPRAGGGGGPAVAGGMLGLAPLQLQLVDAAVRRACEGAHPVA